jgi:hypothetical protein
LILRHAVGLPLDAADQEGGTGRGAAGAMMIPIPMGGILMGVSGIEEAQAVPHVTGVEISAPIGGRIVPLPEGNAYLGFIFAQAADAEAALREAHAKLHFQIKPEMPLVSPGKALPMVGNSR